MKEEKNNRNKWLHLRLTQKEYEHIHAQCSRTTCEKLSDYARNMLFGKPMIAGCKNQSLDDITAVLFKLRKDLNGAANNFNQAVHELHTLSKISEFKAWLMTYESDKKSLLEKIEIIKNYIDKTAEKWLQS